MNEACNNPLTESALIGINIGAHMTMSRANKCAQAGTRPIVIGDDMSPAAGHFDVCYFGIIGTLLFGRI